MFAFLRALTGTASQGAVKYQPRCSIILSPLDTSWVALSSTVPHHTGVRLEWSRR